MSIYTCKKCGKQYESNRLTDGYCDECSAEYRDKYHQVREYLWQHPGITASEIAKACDCNIGQVMKWVKEDRFMLSEDSRVSLYCEICGTKILSGIYCPSCRAEVEKREKDEAKNARIRQHTQNMHGTSTERSGHDDGQMRFLH
ncbi:MAG: hypothetical protein IJV16_07450 [Lachnospiraceae bacterium]|nr:hypothetical protein [Lachnospiraceae bacterium]MBR1523571.1 hypothetical protein [Lachnospiraceae bacterium]